MILKNHAIDSVQWHAVKQEEEEEEVTIVWKNFDGIHFLCSFQICNVVGVNMLYYIIIGFLNIQICLLS